LHRYRHVSLDCHRCLLFDVTNLCRSRHPRLRASVSVAVNVASRFRSEDNRDLLNLSAPGLLAPARLVARAHQVGVTPVPSDRVDLLSSGGHPDAECSVVVARQLTTRAAAIRDRKSTRLAYALPDHVLSAP
jgi:hypothetical protein